MAIQLKEVEVTSKVHELRMTYQELQERVVRVMRKDISSCLKAGDLQYAYSSFCRDELCELNKKPTKNGLCSVISGNFSLLFGQKTYAAFEVLSEEDKPYRIVVTDVPYNKSCPFNEVGFQEESEKYVSANGGTFVFDQNYIDYFE